MEMKKTVEEQKRNSLPLYRLYALFRLPFIPERKKNHCRADFFNLKREPGESAAETWKRILEIEKNCEEITPAELLASNFLSVIRNTIGDNELKKKTKTGDISVEAITDTIHKYMYKKWVFKLRRRKKNQARGQKKNHKILKKEHQTNSGKSTASDEVHIIGKNNMTARQKHRKV